MKSRFGKTKEYLFGKLTDTRAGEIRVVRVFGKAIYEKCGSTERLFGFLRENDNQILTKILSSLGVCLVAIPAFVFMFSLALWYIWKPKSDC